MVYNFGRIPKKKCKPRTIPLALKETKTGIKNYFKVYFSENE